MSATRLSAAGPFSACGAFLGSTKEIIMLWDITGQYCPSVVHPGD